jgi:acetyltransferase-like isoleucine patch superfamily enzyme
MGRDSHIALWSRLDPMLPDLIEFEDDSGVGVGCTLITHSIIDTGQGMTFYYGPIKLCKGSRVGANSVIMPGVTIGEGAIVAAGALVTEDVPEWTIVGGTPARIIRQRTLDDQDPDAYSTVVS